MTDLRWASGEQIFALRAAVLCVREGQLLVISGQGFGFRSLPGGAVANGEDIAGAAAREWLEETGLRAQPLRLAGVVESFFPLGGQRWHEVGFYYRMEWHPDWPELSALADQADQQFVWVSLDELATQRVFPRAAAQLLQAAEGEVLHLIERAE